MSNLVVSAEGLRNYILEGVDNLRIRKCRPDRETIAHYVLRKYGGSLNDIFNELENIVDEGLLLKVEYKGSTSYRTPESFDTKNSPLLTKHSKILNSSRTTRIILTTINDLLVQTPEYCTLGIPLAELKVKLKELEPVRFADDKVDVAFNREVSIGNVLLGDGGCVYPKDIQPKKLQLVNNTNNSNNVNANSGSKGSDPNGNGSGGNGGDGKGPKKRGRKSNAEKAAIAAAAAATTTSPTPDPAPEEEKTVVEKTEKTVPDAKTATVDVGEAKIEEKVAEAVRKTFDGRVSGRNKIKRKVFDPSDVPTPSAAAKAAASASSRKKKRSSSNNEAVDSCEICNKKSDAKNLIVCSSCAASYHTTCLGLTKEQQAKIVLSDWLCSECRICNACSSPLKTSNHVECVKCKSGFHTVCVGDEADFICGECVFNKTQNKDAKPGAAQTSPQQVLKRKGRPPRGRKSEEPTSGRGRKSEEPLASTPTSGRGRKSEEALSSAPTSAKGRKSEEPPASTPTAGKGRKSEEPPASTPTPGKVRKIEEPPSSSPTSGTTSSTESAAPATEEPVPKDEPSSPVNNSEEIKPEDNSPDESTNTPDEEKPDVKDEATIQTDDEGKDEKSDGVSSDTEVVKTEDRPSDLDGKKCSEWTPQDVEKYFNDKGLPEAGALFREQEVDGLSLLLMKRSDVIFGLRLRLGPALKVYKLILQLQNNVTT